MSSTLNLEVPCHRSPLFRKQKLFFKLTIQFQNDVGDEESRRNLTWEMFRPSPQPCKVGGQVLNHTPSPSPCKTLREPQTKPFQHLVFFYHLYPKVLIWRPCDIISNDYNIDTLGPILWNEADQRIRNMLKHVRCHRRLRNTNCHISPGNMKSFAPQYFAGPPFGSLKLYGH